MLLWFILFSIIIILLIIDKKEDFSGALTQLYSKGPQDYYLIGDDAYKYYYWNYYPYNYPYMYPYNYSLWNNPTRYKYRYYRPYRTIPSRYYTYYY